MSGEKSWFMAIDPGGGKEWDKETIMLSATEAPRSPAGKRKKEKEGHEWSFSTALHYTVHMFKIKSLPRKFFYLGKVTSASAIHLCL
jgi:hypothetical protein